MKWFYFGLNNKYCGVTVDYEDGSTVYHVPVEYAVAFELWAMNQKKDYRSINIPNTNDRFASYRLVEY